MWLWMWVRVWLWIWLWMWGDLMSWLLFRYPFGKKKLVTGFFEDLESLAVDYYCPMIPRVVRLSRRRRTDIVMSPAYPGYLFIDANGHEEDKLYDVRLCLIGVWEPKPMKFGNKDCTVSDSEIIRMRDLESQWSNGARPISGERFYAGDEVLVIEGLLKGIKAIVFRSDKSEKQDNYTIIEIDRHTLKIPTFLLKKVGA
jgi:transcription antitermination factor NusG